MSLEGLQGRRIAVIGNSGSGKSTLARALSATLGIKHIELDALNWMPGWRGLHLDDPERFAALVAAQAAEERWITDGNYSTVALPIILPRASDVIWLDHSRPTIMARVLRRSIVRAFSQQELWPGTGNRESVRQWLKKDHPIRWTWDTYHSANAQRAALFCDPDLAHVRKHRLRTPADAQRWVAQAVRAD